MSYLEYRRNVSFENSNFPFSYFNVDPTHNDYSTEPHWHDEYELIRVKRGCLDITINNSSFRLKKGDAIIINNGFIHTLSLKECYYECVIFDLEYYLRNYSDTNGEIKSFLNQQKRFKPFYPSDKKDFQDIFNILFLALKEKHSGYTLIAEGAIWQLLGLILKKRSYYVLSETNMSYTKKNKELKTVLNYIAVNYHNDLTLNDLAGCIHMNPNYFCKFFKELMQKSPIEYLNSYRIEKSCEMLCVSNNTVLNTALDCGFNDVNYFIKVFKRYKGTTPLQYAKNNVNR